MSGVSGAVVLGGVACQGWWLVVDEESGPGRVVAGPFPDRADASWAAGSPEHAGAARPVHGVRRADGGLERRPSPQEWAWLAHLGEQLERLPDGWATDLDEEDPLVTLVVEVTAALCEAGLPLYMQISRDGCVIHLSEHHGDATPGAALRIATEGLEDLHRELMAKGYKYARPGIEEMPWGRDMTLQDPFGNRLTFTMPA